MRKRGRAGDPVTAPDAQAPNPGQQPIGDDGFINDQDAVDSAGEDDDDDDGKVKDKKAGRRKIKIEFIQDKSRRHITFSKRKAGMCYTSPARVCFSYSSRTRHYEKGNSSSFYDQLARLMSSR